MTQDVLTVPWVVLEDAALPVPVAAESDHVAAGATAYTPVANDDDFSVFRLGEVLLSGSLVSVPQRRRSLLSVRRRRVGLFVALTGAWCILFSVLLVAGALTPVRGNVLTYCVMMAGLFLAAFAMLILPRSSEYAETPGGYQVGQCTPSRANTLTGRRSND